MATTTNTNKIKNNESLTEEEYYKLRFGKEVYLAVFDSPAYSYYCEKSGYIVFTFDEDAKNTTEGSGAALFISDSYGNNFLKHTVINDTTIFVPAGSKIYVKLGYKSLANPYVIAKFVPIIDNINDILYEKIHNRNKLINEVINERPIDKEAIKEKDKKIIEKIDDNNIMKKMYNVITDLNCDFYELKETQEICLAAVENIENVVEKMLDVVSKISTIIEFK